MIISIAGFNPPASSGFFQSFFLFFSYIFILFFVIIGIDTFCGFLYPKYASVCIVKVEVV
jgi:hypothetical protein